MDAQLHAAEKFRALIAAVFIGITVYHFAGFTCDRHHADPGDRDEYFRRADRIGRRCRGTCTIGHFAKFTSGILILVLKPYKVGDNIIAQAQEGTVSSIQLFYTVITTFDNKTVIVPNSKLSNELIVNLSREGTRRLDTEMKVAFPVPFEQIRSIVEQAIKQRTAILKAPAYRIGVSHIDPDCYRIIINLWLPAHGFEDERQGFREALLKTIVSSGIKLPDEIHL
jgi:small conductance mechanosensitive channel